jgi:hypothetical protein
MEGSVDKFNFLVELKKGNRAHSFEFSQAYRKIDRARGQDLGKLYLANCTTQGANLFPDVWSLIDCLVMDSDALDYSFPDWADNFGYDSDSIKAKATYDACQANAFKIRELFDLDAVRNYLEENGLN